MDFTNLLQTIRRTFVPIHREGWPFVAAFLVATLVLGFFSDTLFWIGAILTAWCAYFFRDPPRVTQVSDDFVISPADGKVSAITMSVPPRELGLGDRPMRRVSVFMNVFNSHVNRAPVRGRIAVVTHKEGSFANAELDKASEDNERNSMPIEGPHGPVGVVQVAGLVARRIVCWVNEGDMLSAGDRFGLIRFGSRLDVYLPDTATICVAVGQHAIAGETLLARHDNAPTAPVTRFG